MARQVDPQQLATRQETITTAAAELFARHGFENTTATAIARAAGLSSGSVFYYFTDKRAVFRSIFERDLPAVRELVERCRAGENPLESITTMVDELAADAFDPNASGMLVELLRQVDRDPELGRVVAEQDAIVRDGLAGLIERGIEAGLVAHELNPHETAAWIHTIIDSAYLNADTTDPRPMLRRIITRFIAA